MFIFPKSLNFVYIKVITICTLGLRKIKIIPLKNVIPDSLLESDPNPAFVILNAIYKTYKLPRYLSISSINSNFETKKSNPNPKQKVNTTIPT